MSWGKLGLVILLYIAIKYLVFPLVDYEVNHFESFVLYFLIWITLRIEDL